MLHTPRHSLAALLLLSLALTSSAAVTHAQESNAQQATASKVADAKKPVMLFNGKNFDGWEYYLGKDAKQKLEDVWSIEDGVLKCKGRPAGYIYTKTDYANYVLTLQWRWPGKGGNNGVLVHTTPKKDTVGVWPQSLEVQLAADNAGDFWVIGTEIDVENEKDRVEGRRHVNLNDGAEKKLGEWNDIEITCRNDEVIVMVNGKLVNHGTKSTATKGAIALQSEGTPIEYRKVMLREL